MHYNENKKINIIYMINFINVYFLIYIFLSVVNCVAEKEENMILIKMKYLY